MDDMNPMEAMQDAENSRHEDEFSPACELHDVPGCRQCWDATFVETDDGDVDIHGIKFFPFDANDGADAAAARLANALLIVEPMSPTDKLNILLDKSIPAKEALERTGASERRSGQRRSDERCECHHGAFWHMKDGKCMATKLHSKEPCDCLEFHLPIDRRRDCLNCGVQLFDDKACDKCGWWGFGRDRSEEEKRVNKR